jgi:hypothetical protein
MKTVAVKHIHDNKVVSRFLIENEKDIQEAKDNKIIGYLHLKGIRKIIAKGEQVILNESGGYCNMKGTWEFD